ncbi:uncharacterized protein LOC135843629 [Planococcus citri]|uniref:uncharacterized protein LOC135843629 n=1 Tax=Planococcus citri TaxID=170843 RepID=UPI0031F8C109
MEVDHRQEFEMDEVPSGVYDIFHPTPISLKELSAIAISLEIWRGRLHEYRQSGKLNSEFLPHKERFSLKSMLPDLPSAIYNTIEEYLSVFGYSLGHWMSYHFEDVLLYRYKHKNHILEHFDNFVCEYDGNIDYVRTAKRLMCCDRYSEVEKFIIACTYFFEDDIRRIWPSVSSKIDLTETRFRSPSVGPERTMYLDALDYDHCPLLVYYWICRLTNQLQKIPTVQNTTIDETMFDACIPHIRPAVVYFWNRIPSEKRLEKAEEVFGYSTESFARFILPIMDDQLLDKFAGGSGGFVIRNLLNNFPRAKRLVLGTWLYIRNIIGEISFVFLVLQMLQIGSQYYQRVNSEFFFRELWNIVPLHLKRSLIRNISSSMLEDLAVGDDDHHCGHADCLEDGDGDTLRIRADFLLIILEYATLEERTAFWRNCWNHLITLIRSDDLQHLQRIIKLCIEDDDEISRFKRNVLAESDLVQKRCVSYLTNADFDILNTFVSFCFPELLTARTFKQQLLQLAFLGENCPFNSRIVRGLDVFNEFIDEAYQDADSSTDFKNKFVSSPSNQLRLCELTCSGEVSLKELVKFIHSLGSTEQTVSQIKVRMRDYLEKQFGRTRSCNRIKLMGSRYLPISSWCSEQTEESEATSSVNPKKRKKK